MDTEDSAARKLATGHPVAGNPVAGNPVADDSGPDGPDAPHFIRNRFGELYLHEVNRRHFVDESSATVFERQFGRALEADDTLFVVVGSDSGLLHEYLAGLPLGKGSRRIVLESDELHALVEPRTTRAGGAATLYRFGERGAVLRDCGIERYALGGRIELVESLGCLHDHDGRYLDMLRRVRADLAALVHGSQVQVSGQDFIRKQLRNACDNRLPARLLDGIGAGHVAMVLGGGPSLDESMDWIVAHRKSLFLIVASRLCGRLQGLDIRPDVVVAVDPKSGMYDLSKEGLLWSDVPLVSTHHLAPELLQQWRGPHFYMGEPFPWSREDTTGEANFAGIGPTVSHTGAWLAFCCGFERILMSGVDMCFAVGGGTHASGSIERLLGALPSHCDASVVTYDGRTAGTLRALEHGAAGMEHVGRLVNADGPRLFNTSAAAARIDSVPLIDLADVHPSGGRPAIGLPDAAPSAVDHLARVHREQTDALRRFHTIGRRCSEARRLLDAMDAARDDAAFAAHHRKLERLERDLDREHGAWFDTVKKYASAELLATIRPSGFGDEDSGRQDWGRGYYRIVKRTAKTLAGFVERDLARTAARLAELGDAPDVGALLDFWATDDTPGRVLRLDPDLDARVTPAADAFLATLAGGETAHESRLRRQVMDPANILRNLAFLARERLGDDLAGLAGSLRALAPPHDVFADHAEGLRAELEGDAECALACYGAVLDRCGEWVEDAAGIPDGFDALLEDTLRHVSQCYLSLGDGESAAGSLALLAQLSPAYVSRQARLQQLLGNHADALQILEAHVIRFPGDWRALLQMADVYTAANAPEAATLARRLADEARGGERAMAA